MKSNVQTERRDGQNLRRQYVVGLLLLTLLMANPFQALGQGVVNWTSYTGVYLNNYFSPPTNSVTANSGVTINNSTSGNDAISGDTHTWNLTISDATVNGKVNGVHLSAGGSLNNLSGGSISGGNYGVNFSGKAGSVVNSGSIYGNNNAGVILQAGGSVNNLSGGTIEGNNNGIVIMSSAGTVNNASSITGDSLNGISMNQGGVVNNLAGGIIYGNHYGLDISGGAGFVTNYNSITGHNNDGVRLQAGGTVDNESGSILGNNAGVNIIGGAGTVINGGSITGENADGVSMTSGGSVYNFQNPNNNILKAAKVTDGVAGISGGQNGVTISGGTGNVYNNSSIIGGANTPTSTPSSVASAAKPATPAIVGYDGVYLGAGGSVYNDTNGTISGTDNGVNVNASPSSVVNRGSIYGVNSGVYMGQGSTLSNLCGGTITGGDNGVFVSGGAASVYNRGGSISGQTGDGVFMNSGGTVINKNSQRHGNYSGNNDASTSAFNGNTIATIAGAEYGVDISGDKGKVINSGTIIGTNNTGVRLEAGGIVVNQTSQQHRNNRGNDDETASGYNGNNIPTIEGGRYGVEISGGTNAVVINYGSIIGDTRAGVRLRDGGTVVNQTSQQHRDNSGNDQETASRYNEDNNPTIAGGRYGVEISGGEGTVINSGTIIGTNRDGVRLQNGGSVENDRHATISGGRYGVEISNPIRIESANTTLDKTSFSDGYYTVDNSGSISGESRDGVRLRDGGTVYNDRHGEIFGNLDGVHISSRSVPALTSASPQSGGEYTVDNSGTITGTNGNGVWLENSGSVYNGRHGNISGGLNGVVINGGNGSAYVSNDGDISVVPPIVIPIITTSSDESIQLQVGGNGVYMDQGGSVDNGRHGNISGTDIGVEIVGGPGSVSNDGDISGEIINTPGSVASSANSTQGSIGGNGVYLGDGGTVENNRRGSIEGYNGYGVEIYGGPGVVVNSGYIYGGNGTAIQMATALTSGLSNSVTLKSHSETIGNILGGNNGTDAAFLQGRGEYGNDLNDNPAYGFSGFATLTVDASDWRGGWNLTGTNSFSTSATVETGKLRINGELDTPLLTVDEDAILGGSGVINGIVDNHGIFTPGNSIGILTINGSITNGGDYEVQLNTVTNDLILVNGTATITGGNVIVQPDRQIYGSNTVYTILKATNGVVGVYDGSSIEPTFYPYVNLFLASSLLYPDGTNVLLDVRRSKFTTVAHTYNQNSVAGALDGIVDSYTPAMSNLVSEMFWMPDGDTARAALDSLSGEIHGTLGMLDVQQQDAFNNSIAQRTGRLSAGGGSGGFASSSKPVQLASAGSTLPPMKQAETNLFDIWLQGFGSFGHLDGDGNALGGDFTISGLSGGMDYLLSPKLLVGLGLGYSHDDANVGGPGASGKVDAIQLAGYGGYVDGPWHLDGILSYGFLQTDTKRFINVGNIHQEADGKYDGGVLSLSAEGGYAFVFDWLTVEPTIGLDYAHLWQDSFSETGIASDGNNYGLNVNKVDMDSFRSALGVRLAAQFGKKDGVQFIPALRAVWEHEFVDRYADVNARFVGGSGDFDVRGVELGADSGVLGAGLTVAFNKAIQGFVNYDANLNSQLSSHTISGGLSYSW